MKNKLVGIVHSFFRLSLFEKILLIFSKKSYIGSFTSKLVPPNFKYPNPTPRLADHLGYKINVNLNDYNDWKTYWGLREQEREQLYELAKHTTTIVDVGVNNGWVLMNLAKISSKNNGHVYGFEPHPETFKRSYLNISSNNITNATLYNLGCGDVSGELKMVNTVVTNSGQNRIVEEGSKEAAGESEVVKIVRLDEHLRHVDKIDLIKIDVEGFEKKVLEGAVSILEKDKPVLFIELDDILLKANRSSAPNLISFLKLYHYKITRADNKKEIDDQDNLDGCHFDIICK